MSVVLIKHSCSVSAQKDHCAIFAATYIELDFGTDSPGSTWQRTRYHLRQERSCTDSILFDGAVSLKPGIFSVSPNVLRGWIPNGGELKFEDLRAFLNFEL